MRLRRAGAYGVGPVAIGRDGSALHSLHERIQRRAMQARHLQRKCVVACGDAGAALQDRAVRFGARQHGGKRLAQFMAGLEAAVGGQVVLEEAIARAGDVAAHTIDRFVFTAVAVGCACIDHDARGCVHVGEYGCRVDRRFERRGCAEIAGGRVRHVGCKRLAGCFLCLKAAVEHGNRIMAEPAQQPPQARRIRAALRVVHDDLLALLEAAAREQRRECVAGR